jgi:hypothetical protein
MNKLSDAAFRFIDFIKKYNDAFIAFVSAVMIPINVGTEIYPLNNRAIWHCHLLSHNNFFYARPIILGDALFESG